MPICVWHGTIYWGLSYLQWPPPQHTHTEKWLLSQQPSTTNSPLARNGVLVAAPRSMLEISKWLSLVWAMHGQPQLLQVHVCNSHIMCRIQHFKGFFSFLWLLYIVLPLLPYCSLSPGVEVGQTDRDAPAMIDYSQLLTFSTFNQQLWVCALTTLHYNEKLLWSRLREAHIYDNKHKYSETVWQYDHLVRTK